MTSAFSCTASRTDDERRAPGLQPLKSPPEPSWSPVLGREGEQGDNLYVIGSGNFAVLRGSGSDLRRLFEYKGVGAFGELALMYNCPRAATVVVLPVLA